MTLKFPAWLRRLLAEPLLHFALVGAVIFIAAVAVKAHSRPTLHIGREEILATEARHLGLDQDDMIIRRRLAQKMAFATEDVSDAKEPSEKDLHAWYAAHSADYRTPSQVALRQLFFSDDRGPGAQAAARDALTQLSAGKTPSGDPSVLPLTYADVSLGELGKDYGPAFAKAAESGPIGAWQGPVHSG